jgi:hypothetical protein
MQQAFASGRIAMASAHADADVYALFVVFAERRLPVRQTRSARN